MKYVTPEELHDAIIESQRAGRMTPALTSMVTLIVEGFASRHRRPRGYEVDELLADVVLIMVSRLADIDPARSVFNYITTITSRGERTMALSRQWKGIVGR